MKHIIFILLGLYLFAASAKAQSEGIRFAETKSWERAVKQATREGKLLFADCYTQSCAPCRVMAATVFTRDSVGEFFNRRFVCVKYDAENDVAGKMLAERFGISAYPTLLFIDPTTGQAVHKTVGFRNAAQLIAEGRAALDPLRNLAGMQKRYATGERESGFVRDYIALLTATQTPGLEEVVPAYLDSLTAPQLATPVNWALLTRYVRDPLARPFRLVAAQQELFHRSIGRETVDYELEYVIRQAVDRAVAADAATSSDSSDASDTSNPADTADTSAISATSARRQQLIRYLRDTEHPSAPGALAHLYAAEAAHAADWQQLAAQLQSAVRYNLFRKDGINGFFKTWLPLLAENATLETLRQILPLLDALCAKATTFTAKADYMQQKALLQDRATDRAAAHESRLREKKFRQEAEERLEF